MDAKKDQENHINSRPASILRVSGSYRSNHLANNPSITINLPTETANNNTGSDASDAESQQQRRQRREHFEQLRRDHYHNMYSSISGHRQSSASLPRNSLDSRQCSANERESTKSSKLKQPSKK
ncbi:hypothetical protein ACLKA7_003005 [Drosophila subpalustris]